MSNEHPRSIRRRILLFLYERYLQDPLQMIVPADFLQGGQFTREELALNIHYLADRKYIEIMRGYHPPLFDAVRLTADGVDCVENRYQFDLRFPPHLPEADGPYTQVPALIETLVEEIDLAPIEGELRRNALRDVQYLRDELARPRERWRRHVIVALLEWLLEPFGEAGEDVPSLVALRGIFFQ